MVMPVQPGLVGAYSFGGIKQEAVLAESLSELCQQLFVFTVQRQSVVVT